MTAPSVSVGNSLGRIEAGVPQGSCLSPLLYSIYTNDISTSQNSLLALYADDAAYISSHPNSRYAALKLQRVFNLLPEWLNNWRIAINVPKTQAITFTQPRKRPAQLS